MIKSFFRLPALGAVMLVWMLLIFAFSSQPAIQSNRLSRSAAAVIVKVKSVITEGSISPQTISGLNTFIRKSAHFFLYFVLGILIINILVMFKFSGWEAYIQTILLCLLYGVLDEFHQFFVPGRGPRPTDVLIDAAGCAAGVLFFWIFEKLISGLSQGLKRNKYLMDDHTKIN